MSKVTFRTGRNGKTTMTTRTKLGNTTITKTIGGKRTRTTITTRSGNITRIRVW